MSENPSELLSLCKEHNCYPDIWNLYYWSNWLSPLVIKKRFDAAFFIAALENRPTSIRASSEVVNVEVLCTLNKISILTNFMLRFHGIITTC